MSLSGVYGPSDDAASIALIHDALDRGVTLLDSSDAYGKGHNETLLGKALKGRRAGVVVATKFGNLGGAGGKFADGRPEFVISSCEASLKRLGIDVIDLYYQHRVDPEVPIEDTVGAMKKLVEQGKVRALGLSEAAPETIRRAHKVHPIAAVQSEYSLLYRERPTKRCKTTRELGISFVAYAPIGRGLLSADIADPATLTDGDTRKRQPRYSGDNLAHNKSLAQKVAGDGEAEGLHDGAARDRLGAGAGPGPGADPRHQAGEAAGREPRRARREAHAGRGRETLQRRAARRGQGHALSGRADEELAYLGRGESWRLLRLEPVSSNPSRDHALISDVGRRVGSGIGGLISASLMLSDSPALAAKAKRSKQRTEQVDRRSIPRSRRGWPGRQQPWHDWRVTPMSTHGQPRSARLD